jgi:DNA-binding NarL/FixJ family response regulator
VSARRILIVDDHDAFRASAAQLLTLQGCDVVGSASDAEEALEAVERLAPDLVLLNGWQHARVHLP